MGRKIIEVCDRCGKESCDGGTWRIIKTTRLADGKDITADLMDDKRDNCTLGTVGEGGIGQPVGIMNCRAVWIWSPPCQVVFQKVAE